MREQIPDNKFNYEFSVISRNLADFDLTDTDALWTEVLARYREKHPVVVAKPKKKKVNRPKRPRRREAKLTERRIKREDELEEDDVLPKRLSSQTSTEKE